MIVYQADKAQFLSDNDDKEIDDVIRERYEAVTGRSVAENEVRSWRDSLARMANVLRDQEIPLDAGVAVEFHIPQSSKRIDVMVTGHGEDEPSRICRRLHTVRGWSHEQSEPVLARSA